MLYHNGDTYEGSWDTDQFWSGSYKVNGTHRIEVRYGGGDECQYGRYEYENGDVYQGWYMKDGYKWHEGTMTYANGDVYVGEWKVNQRWG